MYGIEPDRKNCKGNYQRYVVLGVEQLGLFPESFYNNTLPKKLAKKEKEIPLLKDIKQDIETGKFILDNKSI